MTRATSVPEMPASPAPATSPPTVTVTTSARRALAGLIGWGLGGLFWTLALLAFVLLDPDPPAAQPWNLLDRVVDYLQARPSVLLVAFVAAILAAFVVPFVFLARGRPTPGMRLLGFALVDHQGAPPRPLRVLGWLAARFALVGLAGLSLYWSLVDPQRRTLHDRVAGLWLIARPASRAASAAPPPASPPPRAPPLRDRVRTPEGSATSARSEPIVGSWGGPTEPR